MRHQRYNPDFSFVVEPEHFNKYTDRDLLQYCLGATMYMPGYKDFLEKILDNSMPGLTTMVLDFEDACPDWKLITLGEDNLSVARQMVQDWYREHGRLHPEAEFAGEQKAIDLAFENFTALGFEGLLLVSGGRTVAFTMGNRIRRDVFDVNFEKAVADIQGAYAMINRSFARYLSEKYPELNFLNREDDMGIAGLRKAKLSYYPDLLLRKWVTISTPEAVLR